MIRRQYIWRYLACIASCLSGLHAQQPLNWTEVKTRFLAANPGYLAGQINVEETRANEITAGLRPNPQISVTTDQYQFFPSGDSPFRPLANAQFIPTISQLFERKHKRELRVQSARLATAGAQSDQADLERTMMFSLRDAFNRTLQGKALLDQAKSNLDYYDKIISVNQDRFKAGDIAKVDFQRVELQRIQFESDYATAQVNYRTAKIQLLALLNDRTPVDQFNVTGDFDYKETIILLPELREAALHARPDLQSAETAMQRASAENRLAWANGSADPTVGAEYLWNSSVNNTIGANVQIPLRIFDRNQGEKARTALDIRRTEKVRDNVVAGIYRDVESAYASLDSVRSVLRPYRQKYLQEAQEVRDLISFSYSNGGASLLEFLDAQKSYRDTEVAYINLVGSYLSAAAQLNLAVGQEVIQ